MRKILNMFIITLSFMTSYITLADNNDHYYQIVNQRLGVVNGLRSIYETNTEMLIVADIITADEFLRQIPNYDTSKKLSELELVFPDIDYINEYIEEVSKRVNEITIYLLSKENDDKYMKNRDYNTYISKKVDEKVKKLDNVKVISIAVNDMDITEIFLESLTKIVYNTNYYAKYIKK